MLSVADVHVDLGRVHALRGVSLTVRERTIFTVLGANGAGKTTLLRAVMGLERLRSGAIYFAGASLDTLPAFERARRGIVLVPSGRRLFADFTVRENLIIGAFRRTDRGDVERDLAAICDTFPPLAARYRQRAKNLSGGEGQMLAIGRALMARPRLILLDEPSMGLMPNLVTEIFDILRQIPERGVTALLAEQNAKQALAVSDRVAVLETGRVVLDGGASEIANDPRIREAYLGG